jgi:S-formylglutathione hydrolase
VVLFLHGHSQETLVGNPVFTTELERRGLRAVCPHGGRAWWLDLVCPEFDPQTTPLAFVRDRVVAEIGTRWGVRPPMIALLGISMGGQGILQLAYRRPREFPVVAAISPAVDFQNLYGQGLPLDTMFRDREAARQQTATLQLHPMSWPRHQFLVCDPADADWIEGVERLTMKLRSLGIPFEADLKTSAGGHSWSFYNAVAPAVIGFIAERLEQEGRGATK